MKLKRYTVELTQTVTYSVDVDAASEEEARENAVEILVQSDGPELQGYEAGCSDFEVEGVTEISDV